MESTEVFARGFMQFDEDDSSGFSMRSIEVKPYVMKDLSCLCAGMENLLIATKKYTILRKRLNPDQPFEVLAISCKGDSEVRKMFIDTAGYHCIFLTSQKEAFYLHYQSDQIIPLNKLKELDVTSIAFNINSERESTGSILVGTRNGAIFTYGIGPGTGKQKGFVEATPQKVCELPGKPPIFGLVFESYECFIKNENVTGTTTLVMAATLDAIYQFTGRLPFDALFQKYQTPKDIERHKRAVPKGTMQESEFKLFHIYNTEKKRFELHSFAWKCEVSLCHGKFRAKDDKNGHVIVKDLIAEGYQKKDTPPYGKVEVAEAVGVTEYCIYFLYKDNLTVISKITKEIEYSETFSPSEPMTQMVYEVGTKSMWIYSQKGLYRLIVTGASKDLWKQQLESSNFQEALKLCKESNSKYYGFVAAAFADSKFKDGKFNEAAALYASSNRSFEEVALKFLLSGENDGLEEYLTLKLNSIIKMKNMKVQQVLLCSWLMELKLDKLNRSNVKMDDMQQISENSEYGNIIVRKPVKYDPMAYRNLSEELNKFFENYDECLDTETILQLLQDNGKLSECLIFAAIKNKHEVLVLNYINNRVITKALQVLQEMKDEKKKNALMLKYASFFMKYEPVETFKILKRSFSTIDVEGLLPALMGMDKQNRFYTIEFLRTSMQRSQCSRLVHNLYLYFLAENQMADSSILDSDSTKVMAEDKNDPKTLEMQQELLDFINQQAALQLRNQPITIDKFFALNVCKHIKNEEAQVRLYGMLEFYEEAVKLALKANKIELAKEYASRPNDEKIKKKLWLTIANVSMQNQEDMKTGLEIISESKGSLILNDVLSLISPKVKLKAFKDDLLAHLNSYKKKIEDIKTEMNDYKKGADDVTSQIKSLKAIPVEFNSDKFCDYCGKPLLGEGKFYVFQCGHGFHKTCLIQKLFAHRSYGTRTKVEKLEVLEIFKQKMQILLRKRGFPIEMTQGIEVLNYAAELLKRGKVEFNGEIKEIKLSAEDYQVLGVYNSQLEGLLTDECILCGNMFIDTLDMPFDSADESLWVIS